jgi:hypothetical protein
MVDLPADELAAVTAAIRRAIEDDKFPHAPPGGGSIAAKTASGARQLPGGQLTSTAAPEALAARGETQPERDYNKGGAGPFPVAHREPSTRLISVKAPPSAPA